MRLTIAKDKGNKHNRLTVRADGTVKIKTAKTTSESQRKRTIRQLTLIAKEMLDYGIDRTFRGSSNRSNINMYNSDRTKRIKYIFPDNKCGRSSVGRAPE